jgi:hypothetical protein
MEKLKKMTTRVTELELEKFKNNAMNAGLSLNTYVKKAIEYYDKHMIFKADELCILRNIDKKYKWIFRDGYGISVSDIKPIRDRHTGAWESENGDYLMLQCFNEFDLFQGVNIADEEPLYIDDYVERGAE